MNIVVYGGDTAGDELIRSNPAMNWIKVNSIKSIQSQHADAFFSLDEDAAHKDYSPINAPVFVNSVVNPLSEIKGNENVIRINGWNGFLSKQLWEVCGKMDNNANEVLSALNKEAIQTADVPGFISARIIAMIINEAYYTKGESVSSEKEIDIAMKLGTNYPYGPFEWARFIGLRNIHALLERLTVEDTRYLPAPELIKNLNNGAPPQY